MDNNSYLKEMKNYEDADISNALSWLMSHRHEEHWPPRMAAIEKSITDLLTVAAGVKQSARNVKALKVKEDQIGWYIYLMTCLTEEITKYEPYQGARIAPIFKRIGADLHLIKQIGGIEDKVKKMLKSGKNEADSGLFEILCALMWTRNGWDVSFIPESSQKTPELKAVKDGELWFIECKRFSQRSAYSIKEQNAWLAILSHVTQFLLMHNLILEVTFHKEIHTLAETILLDLLLVRPEAANGNMKISNAEYTLKISKINIVQINKHLEKYHVKSGSPFLRELIGGNPVSTGFSTGLFAKYGSFGPIAGFNQYIMHISNGYAVDWKCDAPEAIASKARDIFHHLKEANDQHATGVNAVIHIGIETLDGSEVEMERFEKILHTTAIFDKGSTGLNMVYCHFFQSYALPNVHFTLDETKVGFAEQSFKRNLLEKTFLINTEDLEINNELHWKLPHP